MINADLLAFSNCDLCCQDRVHQQCADVACHHSSREDTNHFLSTSIPCIRVILPISTMGQYGPVWLIGTCSFTRTIRVVTLAQSRVSLNREHILRAKRESLSVLVPALKRVTMTPFTACGSHHSDVPGVPGSCSRSGTGAESAASRW